MKFLLAGLFFIQCFCLSAQYELIKTGRPQPYEYNNAEQTVGKRWGITFGYIAFDGVNFDLLDSITLRNETVEKKLAAKKGAAWNRDFRAEVETELKKQNELRALLQPLLKNLDQQDLLIHFEQGKWNQNKYKAFVFGQIEKDGKRPFYILRTYKIKVKSSKIKLRSAKISPIHFDYPENDISGL